MNLFRVFQSIRSANNISYAIKEGRKPTQQDLVRLGLQDIFPGNS